MRGVLAAGLVLALGWAAPSGAVTYSINGSCNGTCGNIGLERGDLVLGRLTINRPTIVIGGTFDESNLASFSVSFGSNTISNTNTVGVSLVGVWGSDLTTIAALDLRTSTAVSPGTGLGLQLMLGGSILSTAANCPTASCDVLSWTSAATVSPLTLQEVPGPVIPLPPALPLLAGGMGCLALVKFAAGRRSRAA